MQHSFKTINQAQVDVPKRSPSNESFCQICPVEERLADERFGEVCIAEIRFGEDR